MKNSFILRLLAALMAFSLVGIACASGEGTTETDAGAEVSDEDSDTGMQEATAEPATLDSPAASLDQGLAQLLGEHEYLAGITVAMGVMNGTDSAEFSAAADALDANSVDLSNAVASVYGDAGGKQFLKLWRAHIGFFVDYTVAGGKGPNAAKAKKALDGYRSDFGAFIESATGGALTKDAVEDALKPHVESTLTAIDTVLGNRDGNPFLALKDAADHMPHISNALATGIATDQGLEGDAAAASVELQRTLTHLLNEHEYLAGTAVAMAVMKGADSAEFSAAADALDANSVDLSEAIASVYGDAGGQQFLKLWRAHIGFFVDYTLAGGRGPQAAKAKEALDGYRSDFGAFIDSATEGGLSKTAVEDALKPHVESTLAAIDTVLGNRDGNPFLALKEAAHHLPSVATALSGAIVEQSADMFL